MASKVASVTATIIATPGLFTTSIAVPKATQVAAQTILDPGHPDPTHYDASNPLPTFILQAVVIVGLSRFLALFLGRMRQPRVISEVLAGILIGPTAFGRIPGFTQHIFPPASIPNLTLVANIGLVLFLFLVGLEVDFSLFKTNARLSGTISAMGMVIPFALGAAVSYGVYERFIDHDTVKFGTFLLFVGVANAITAFPVLARILVELEMLSDHVGVIVLAAGVGNDVVGWILLALAVALVNASSGVVVVYVLLCVTGWILVLWFIGRPLLMLLCRKTGSLGEKGPSPGVICAVIFLVLISAWITDRLGVHAIFGGFVAGLIVPTQIRSSLTEKIEDLMAVLFLPLYFALSGLKTDLGLLANGSIWGWTVCVVVVAFFSKFLSCGLSAKAFGMKWRESAAVGSLMACKGLVELIVLNIGLNAKILNNEVFAMFVFMALVTTFVTTPLTMTFYSKSYRAERARELRAAKGTAKKEMEGSLPDTAQIARFALVLDRFEYLPAVFAFSKLLRGQANAPALSRSASSSEEKVTAGEDDASTVSAPERGTKIEALHLVELTDRTSSLIRASELPDVSVDPLSQVVQAYGLGQGIPTTATLSIVPTDIYPDAVATFAAEKNTDMLIIPWAIGNKAEDSGLAASVLPNPFESFFGAAANGGSQPQYASFIRRVLQEATCDVGLFLHRALRDSSTVSTTIPDKAHVFFAYHGGTDDRACLHLLMSLLIRHPGLRATVVRVTESAEPTAADESVQASEAALTTRETTRTTDVPPDAPLLLPPSALATSAMDTLYPTHPTAGGRVANATMDELAFARYFGDDVNRSDAIKAAASRVTLETVSSHRPLTYSIAKARLLAASLNESALRSPLVILAGRGRRDGSPALRRELEPFLKAHLNELASSIAVSAEVRKSLGDIATAYVVSGAGDSVFVVQQKGQGGRMRDA